MRKGHIMTTILISLMFVVATAFVRNYQITGALDSRFMPDDGWGRDAITNENVNIVDIIIIERPFLDYALRPFEKLRNSKQSRSVRIFGPSINLRLSANPASAIY